MRILIAKENQAVPQMVSLARDVHGVKQRQCKLLCRSVGEPSKQRDGEVRHEHLSQIAVSDPVW